MSIFNPGDVVVCELPNMPTWEGTRMIVVVDDPHRADGVWTRALDPRPDLHTLGYESQSVPMFWSDSSLRLTKRGPGYLDPELWLEELR